MTPALLSLTEAQALAALRSMILGATSSTRFSASISRSLMTVADVLYGNIRQGQLVQDAAGVVVAGTRVGSVVNASPVNGGGLGIYSVSVEQDVPLVMMMSGGLEVLRGQANRVAEPFGQDFAVMTPMRQDRLAYNETGYTDNVFTGAINGNLLTVSAVARSTGPLVPGMVLIDTNFILNPGTVLGPQILGTSGGIGTYLVGPPQTIAAMPIFAGLREDLVPTTITVQLDVHGPASGDNAKIVEGLLYSEYGFEALEAATGFGVAPLSVGRAIQAPFINSEQQYEYRWTMDVDLQIDPTISTPQTFADRFTTTLVPVDIIFPPGPGPGPSPPFGPVVPVAPASCLQSKIGNYSITFFDNGAQFDNSGASGPVAFTLPPWLAGCLSYSFVVVSPFLVTVQPQGSDRIAAAPEGLATSVFSAFQYSYISVRASNDPGLWIVNYSTGGWSYVS